jgi:hypothetical protein
MASTGARHPSCRRGLHVTGGDQRRPLPESMKRSMSRQAEAEGERPAPVITADGELQTSAKLNQAAATMADNPASMELRLLQTVVEVAAEKRTRLWRCPSWSCCALPGRSTPQAVESPPPAAAHAPRQTKPRSPDRADVLLGDTGPGGSRRIDAAGVAPGGVIAPR